MKWTEAEVEIVRTHSNAAAAVILGRTPRAVCGVRNVLGLEQVTAGCSIDDCPEPYFARGWCKTHYGRWYRNGDPNCARPGPRRGRSDTRQTTPEMYADYVTGMTMQEVADKWGTAAKVVSYRFKQLGLPVRPRGVRPGTAHGCFESRQYPGHFAQANADRAKRAAAAALPLIEAALSSGVTPRQRRTLQLRLEHPDASLAELAALHDPPITKDSVAGIMRTAFRKAGA